jgi:serine/threonine protein kinase
MTSISNENAKKYIESLGKINKLPMSELVPFNNSDAQDLIDRLLDLNPNTRITVDEALEHPYLASLHDPDDEPIFEGDIDFSFESNADLTLEGVRKLILQEISSYNIHYQNMI